MHHALHCLHTLCVPPPWPVYYIYIVTTISLEFHPYPLPQVPALREHTVVDVAVGAEHTLALTADGRVFAWGTNNDGQLGLGHTAGVRVPQLIASLVGKHIRQVR